MSPTLLREYIFRLISKFSILFFAILAFIFNVNYASATTLSACGEIAVSGTYTLSSDLGTIGVTCLNITTSGVVIDGDNQYSVLGNIVGDPANYSLINFPAPILPGILGDFYFNNAAADGNWGNKSNWTTAALPTSSDNVFITGNVSSYAGNKALALNGSGYASRASAVSLGTVFSLDFWMKSSAMPTQILLTEAVGSCSPIAFSPNNNPTQVSANIGCGANNWTIWYNVTVADSQWHHWVLTRNVRNLKLYRDGVLIGTATPNTSSSVSYTNLGSGVGGAQKLTGSLDQFVYWSKELTQAEVTARFNLGAGAELTDYTSVIAEYRFDNNYNDSSPNARHLAAGGTGNSFVAGALSPSSNPYPQVQELDVQSGTVSTPVQTTAGAKVRGTANITGNIIGTADFYGDLSNLNGSISDINNINLVTKGYLFAADRTNYVSIPHNSSIDLSPPFSVGFWVKTSETSRTNLFSKMNKATWRGWYVHLLSNKIIAAINQDGANHRYLFSAANINDGQWKHVVVNFGSYNVSDIDIYVNGVEGTVSEASSGTVTTILNTNAALISNSSTGNQTEYFDGQLTGSFIYNRSLTPQEISAMYQSGTMVTGTAQKLYLKMNGNFTDSSQYGNNGTGFNSPVSVFAKLPIIYPDNATIRRIYETDATTTRDFTLNGGRWIVESEGADINLSGATYAVSTTTYQSNKNVFRAKNGAAFTENPSINGGAHVVPKVVINSPVAGLNMRWIPDIDWDDADTCEYKWGSGGAYTTVDCGQDGIDIPKPTAFATTTLYVKGTYEDTSYSEQLVEFLYDNTTPVGIASCDYPLDESTREYYYLENDIVGDCTVTADITLKGNIDPLLPGYTITGQLIANATSTTDGFDLTLQNITVTGTTTANGSGPGNRGGDIIVADSNLNNIVTNGGDISLTDSVSSLVASNSNSGGILGGDITVSVSTTTAIYANGGDITVSTSSVGLLDSTSPTDGVAGGDITITNPISTIPSITTNGGDVTLNNVTVTGDITANGNTGGVSAGAITIENSTTTAIYANGGAHTSGNGGHGATITIATSTTGLIEASGADSTGDGGDGGIITITNSIGTSATSTPITANGGDSTSCGDGGDSGIITIVDTTYGTITAEPGVGFNGGCPSDTKSSGTRNAVTTVGQGHSSIPRPSPTTTPSNPNSIGGGINPLFRNGLNNIDFTPIQQFNLFGDGNGGGFKPIDAGTTRLPKVFTDLNRLNDFLLDEMPVDILPSLELFVFDTITEDLANLFPNSSNLLAAVGVERSQELAGLFRSPKLLSDISNPEKYGLFKVYSGDVVVNTYVAYEEAIENLAQLIKANPSQIIHIGTYAKGKITDESKVPYIIYQGQKKLMTPTFDGYYATSVIAPNLEGRYLIETSSDVQILLDVLPQNQSNEQSKPWGVFHKLWKLFH